MPIWMASCLGVVQPHFQTQRCSSGVPATAGAAIQATPVWPHQLGQSGQADRDGSGRKASDEWKGEPMATQDVAQLERKSGRSSHDVKLDVTYYDHLLYDLWSKEVWKSNFRQYGQMESRGVKSQRREEQKREDQRRERVRKKKMQVCEKVAKSRNTVCFQWFVAPEGRKVGSLKRRARSYLARWEMKNCTPLWREAHFEVKMHKTPQFRSTFRARLWREAHIEVKIHKRP